GTPGEAAAGAIAAMRAAGATVVTAAADLTKADAVAALFARIAAEMPPLKGILHTAMVIDDALFHNLDAKRIEAVMAPKIAGAATLDRLSRGLDLDLFVLYSSATTLIGNPGQAAYVAANAYLEGLARARRAAGLPALAIAWGAIGDAGYLARNLATSDILATRLGKQTLSARAALAGLGMVLDSGVDMPVVAYARVDWAAARRELPLMATPFAGRVAAHAKEAAQDSMGEGQLLAMIEGLDHAQAQKVVVELLGGEISRILRLPAEDIDPSRPLTEVGMDSLMALELRMAAEQRLGIDIPLLSLANGATLGDIARRIVDKALARDGAAEVSADAELAAARHVDGELDEDMTAVANAVEARAGTVKRLI
ncbi:beta-ketoacyl reductase, partial [Oharaeibacter diazotrophicus]